MVFLDCHIFKNKFLFKNQFEGSWTEAKMEIVVSYAKVYLTIIENSYGLRQGILMVLLVQNY
jgi:hypothetical protein